MIDSLPRYVNRESRHGHNLSHDFSFTSSTGHLLTLFGVRLDPKDTIEGRIDMFTRTQPLIQPANVEIEEFVDYFFVPLEMLYSGIGDYVYQVNEPYSSVTQQVLETLNKDLPVLDFPSVLENTLNDVLFRDYSEGGLFDEIGLNVDNNSSDSYYMDNAFFSVYRNLFHNYMNPNALFKYLGEYQWADPQSNYEWAIPADYFQPSVFPVYLLAYNCIYQHFYRLDDREQFNASTYNIDAAMFSGSSMDQSFNLDFYTLRYRPRFFDYFTSAKVAPLINSNNILSTTVRTTDLTRINNYLSTQGVSLSADSGSNVQTLNQATQVKGSGSITATSSLRSLFAVEKLLSITNRAKKTYDAQVLAHLGVDMPVDYFHNIQYIGTQKSTVKVGEVVSTAGTEDAPLGDIAGKGYASLGDKGVKFTAPCHGVFMAIYSAVPKVRYYAPLEKHSMLTDRLSFYQPEFAQLGMQPIFGYEAFAAPESKTSYVGSNFVLGWQMRYEELKKRFNKVSPAFVDTVIKYTNPQTGEIVREKSFNDWHTWTVVERPYQLADNPIGTSLYSYLASPQMLNGLMASQYLDWEQWKTVYKDTGYSMFEYTTVTPAQRNSFAWDVAGLFKRDPLLHFANINFKLVNKIPDNTLPSLNVM